MPAVGSGSRNLLSATDKPPSPEGNRGAKRRARKWLDKRLPMRTHSPASREGSLLAIDERLDKQQPNRRHRGPVSGTMSGSPRITSPGLTSPRPEPLLGSGGAIPNESSRQYGKVRDASSSPRLPDHWSLQKRHSDGYSAQLGSYDEEIALAKKVASVVGTVVAVSAALIVVIFLLWRSSLLWGAQARGGDFERHFCASPECEKAMARILSSELRSADPCTDFYHYACGRWTPLDSEGRATDYADEMFRNYSDSLYRLMDREDNSKLRWSSQSIRNFYQSCYSFMNTASSRFFDNTFAELDLTPGFWQQIKTINDLTAVVGNLCMRTGLPSIINVTTRNAILQIDVGTTLTASLKPFGVLVTEAISFVCGVLKPKFNNSEQLLHILDAEMEGYRAQFDRSTHFTVPLFNNRSGQLDFFYKIAMDHADAPTRKIMEGTILVRGLDLIGTMAAVLTSRPYGLAALYCYMVSASEMLGYELQRQQQNQSTRENISSRCLNAVLDHFGSGFLHWAARFLQSRYAVDAARIVSTSIVDQYLRIVPPSLVNDFRAVVNRTSFHFYADHASEAYSYAPKITTLYTRDNFLRNLVLHSRSPSMDRAKWSPFQQLATLAPLGSVVHDKHLYLVVGPMHLMEDFFYADATDPSLNLATLGGYMASEIMKAVSGFDVPDVVKWKQKVEACHRANAKLLGWEGVAKGEDFAALRLSVAFGAACQKDRTNLERNRLFFQRFALMSCATNASRTIRQQINHAVQHIPEFAMAFQCKSSGLTPCHV